MTGTTDINPISKIPPPDPVTASAFYQKGEDYIQVVWTKISKNFLLLRQQLVAGEMGSTCRDDPLHQWVPGPILISSHLIFWRQVAWRENLKGTEEEEEFNIVDIDQPDIFRWV